MMKVNAVQGSYTKQDAQDVLKNCDAKINIVKVEELYYPYIKIKYALKLEQWLSKLEKRVSCVIDLVYGRPAVGQGTPKFDELEIDEGTALKPLVSKESLYNTGHDFVFKLFLNKAKILHTPDIIIEEELYFHKKFYIVHCKDPKDRDYFVMVDSMDGSLSILDWKTEEPEEARIEQKRSKIQIVSKILS